MMLWVHFNLIKNSHDIYLLYVLKSLIINSGLSSDRVTTTADGTCVPRKTSFFHVYDYNLSKQNKKLATTKNSFNQKNYSARRVTYTYTHTLHHTLHHIRMLCARTSRQKKTIKGVTAIERKTKPFTNQARRPHDRGKKKKSRA